MKRFLLAVFAASLAACAPPAERGLNDRFLDPKLDARELVDVFEAESREIFVRRQAISDALDLTPGMVVADVGAGTGLFLEPFAEAVGVTGKIYAVDISPRLVDYMTTRAREAGLTQVEPVLCSERSARLPEASTDLIFVCDTYHHFSYPEETLASLHRALRPGGTLVVVDFERIPGVSRDWILDHVRAGKEEVITEIEAAGFELERTPEIEGLEENYMLRFRRITRHKNGRVRPALSPVARDAQA